jgi:hypothetical protein
MSDAAIRKENLHRELFSFDTEFHSYYTQPVNEYLHKKVFMANFGD